MAQTPGGLPRHGAHPPHPCHGRNFYNKCITNKFQAKIAYVLHLITKTANAAAHYTHSISYFSKSMTNTVYCIL